MERSLLRSQLASSLRDLDETDCDTIFAQIRSLRAQRQAEEASVMVINGKRYKKTTIDKMAGYNGR